MNVSGTESQLSLPSPKGEVGGRRRSVTWFFALTPWISILVMTTMIAHALIAFGREVYITQMTEFSRSLQIHESIFGLSLLIAIVSFPIWIATACSRRFRLKTSEHFLQLVLYGMGGAAINFSPVLDPTGLANRLINW